MDLKIGDCVIITDLDINDMENRHYLGEIGVIDRIEKPYYYYLKNDEKIAFTDKPISSNRIKKYDMIKCKKCGSTNVKVNYNQVYTSIPAMYAYRCNDCGELGYVNSNEAYMDNDGSSLNNEKINTPKENNNEGGLLGWICPKCGRCYSPYTSMCSFCNNQNWHQTITCSTSGTNKSANFLQ